MISRREWLVLLGALGAIPVVACTSPGKAPSPPVAAVRLRLDPLPDIVSGVGLRWLLQAKPVELLADNAVARALEPIVPAARIEMFAERYGGVDWRRAREVIVAGYRDATFAVARLPVDPVRVEGAFATRATTVEGRTDEHGVTRVWGLVDGEPEQIAIFGREAMAIERGRLGPLRPAVYFAQGKLRRARPVLRAEPLAGVAERVGEAPLRGFVPGPFEGSWAAGLGGLLRVTTAVAGAVTLAPGPAGQALRVRVLLAGDWGNAAAAAGERLAAAFQMLATDPLGHLMGVDRPVEPARVSPERDTLELEVTLDLVALARGLHAGTGASLHEILGLSAAD